MNNSADVHARAEAKFKKRQIQATEGAKAKAEYEAAERAVAEKTTRLKALRLAKEQADEQKTQQRKSG